jgi:hypothetical protein
MADDRTVYKFEGDASGLIRATKEAKKAIRGLADSAKNADKEIDDLDSQNKQTAVSTAALGASSLATSGALAALTVAATAAAVAIAAVVVAAAAIVVAVAAITTGFSAAVVAVHKFILAAEDARKELEPLYELGALEPLPPEQIAALERYSLLWKAVKVTIQNLMVAVAGNLAKDLEGVLYVILVMTIHLSNLVKGFLKGTSLIGESISRWVATPLLQVIDLLDGVLILNAQIVRGLEAVGLVSAGTYDKMQGALDTAREKTMELGRAVTGLAFDGLSAGVKSLAGEFSESQKQADALISSLKTLGAVEEETPETLFLIDAEGKKTKKKAKKEDEDQKEGKKEDKIEEEIDDLTKMSDLLDGINGQMTDLTDPTGLLRDMLGEISGTMKAIAEADFSNLEDTLGVVSGAFKSLGNIMKGVIDQQIRANDELTEKQKKNLKILFAIQKASAITSIVIDTATAIMRALAELGPVAGGIASGFITATGIAQVATVASQKPPFHTGGIIPAAPGKQGVQINALPGEAVLNRDATAGLGAEGVADLNSGRGGDKPIVVEMVYKHRVFDVFIADNLAKGGPLADAIASKGIFGFGAIGGNRSVNGKRK